VSVSSAGDHHAIALAVPKLRDRASRLPWRWSRFRYDLDATRLESLDGDFDVVVNQHEDGPLGWCFVLAPQEVEGGIGAWKSEFDPSSAIIAHGLIRDDAAIQVIDIERLGAFLVEHRNLRELDVHRCLSHCPSTQIKLDCPVL